MERLIGWWVHNPIAANLLMVGILLAGFLGFQAMEREAFPRFGNNTVTIEVAWPGAAPQEVEEQVILRIEEALKDLDNVYHVYSTATENFARVDVSTYSGNDLQAFLNEVKNAVDSVTSLPRDAEPPKVRRERFDNEMIRVAVHGDISERALTRLAEDLRDEVAALPYVSIVNLFGARREEVTIEVSESALRRYNLNFSQVADAIRSSSVNLSSGRVRTDTGDVLLRARNLADNERDFSDIVIRQTEEGALIRVSDVARVVDGFEDEEILATLNGQPSVLLMLMASENMQIAKASAAVTQWMEEKRPDLPDGVSLTLWFDQADIYTSRMELIGESSLLGLILVFLVLILSLRPKVALWVTGGIAVAFMGTFSLLPGYDVSLNVMSTFAFLLVLGIVVDDAIVVGESIHEHAHRLGGGEHAAIAGATAVARPVIFAVLTTMIAFAPWFFLDMVEAEFTKQFSTVITVALTISLIEAFFILPAHLRHLQPRKNLKGLRLRQRKLEEGIVGFANTRYRRLLDAASRHRYLTTSVFFGAFVISMGLFNSGWVKFAFMPDIENELIDIQIQLPAGTPYSRALTILDQLAAAEKQLMEEVNQRALEEGGSGKLVESWYTRSRRDSVIAIVKLAPPEVRDMSSRDAATRLRELIGEVPDADEIEVNYTFNRGGNRSTVLLRHRDMELLRAASHELQLQMRSYEGAYYVRDSLQGDSDELHLSLLPGAHKLGLTLAEVSRQVRQAYFGEEVQRLPRENGDVKVMVRYPRDLRENLHSLNNFRIRTGDGREIPLMAVADVELASGVQRIRRRDGERMVQVHAEVDRELISDINQDLNENYLPTLQERYPELEILKGGDQEVEEEFISRITALYAIAFFCMYALIAVAFHSYWLPLLIMTAIPFGFMGAVYGHMLFGVPMAMFSYFGIGAAAGVVVNDNLVLVDFIRRLRAEGHTAVSAVVEAGVHRFRPILLTTITTFVGLLPIMAERSTSSEFLKPAVLSLAFGVLFALFITLLMVPALYLVGEDIKRGLQALKQRLTPSGSESLPQQGA